MSAPGLKRRLGLGLLTLYGVGVMVGAGIYVLIGAVAGETGVYAPLAFVLAGVIAVPTAISYSELSTRIPQSAGEAAYLSEATGSSAVGVIVGAAVALTGVVSAAAVLLGGVGYLRALIDVPATPLILFGGAFLGLVAIWGVVESLAFAAILTMIEIAGLVIVIAVGFGAESVTAEPPPAAMIPALGGGALLAFFAYVGFEDMVNMAEETKDVERTMPRAIILAVAITTLLYVLVAWAAVRVAPASALRDSQQPLALVFEAATGGNAGFLSLIAVAAALNGILAMMVMSARVLFGLGRISPAFRVFHHAHPRLGTPVLASAVVAAVVIALALAAPIEALAEATSVILLVVFTMVNGALLVLKRRAPAAPGFRAPLFAPILGVVFSLAALAFALV